jgi:glycosyl transferase family 25
MNYTCYVLHVKRGYEDREVCIIDQFNALGLEFEWVLDHDKQDLSPDILAQYGYRGDLPPEAISCSMKHIAAWERIAAGAAMGGLILEDDALLDKKRFLSTVDACLQELKRDWGGRGCICLGNGCAMFVPWTKLKSGKRLYRAEVVRATDSYYIDRHTAVQRLDWIRKNGFDLPADHLINTIDTRLGLVILWAEPTVVTQGSHTGLFASSIQLEDTAGWWKRSEWAFKIARRKYIYPLLGKDLRKG